MLKQHRETGSIAPKVRTEQTPTKLSPEQLKVLEQLVEANNDATLAELQEQLRQKTGVRDRSLDRRPDGEKAKLKRQKKTLNASEKHSERVQQQRSEFWQLMQGNKSERPNLH